MRILLSFLFLQLPLLAQTEIPIPGINPTNRVQSTLKAPDPYALHTPEGVLFEQPAMNGDDIAIMYFQLTGKRVLPSQAASTLEIKILQPGPLTNQEVAELIETKLIMEGYALTESPGNPRQLRLVQAAGGNASISTTGPRLIEDANLLPLNDEIVTYPMKMDFMKPEEATGIFQSIVGQFGPAGKMVAVPNASKVMITDNALLIRTLIKLKEQIDVPSSNISTKFIELTYADAEEIAAQINELVNEEQSTTSSVQRANNNTNANNTPAGILPNTPAGESAGAGESIPLKIVAEPRTNRVVLIGSPGKILVAEGLIAEFDKPSSEKNSLRRRLKYLPVSEFMAIATNAIEATLGESTNSTSPSSNRSNNNQPSSNNNSTNSGSSTSSNASVGGQDGTTTPESQLVGKTLLVADNISNSIIVNGPPHHIEIVQNLLNELDQSSSQVGITAVFGRYGNNNENSFNTEIASLFNGDSNTNSFGGGTSNIAGIYDAATLADFATSLGAGFNVGFSDNNFGAFLNATKTIGGFEEFSRPTVFTTNNRAARISSGSRIAVPTGSVTGVSTTTQIDFRDVTLDLEIRPLVNGDDEITLEISLINDTLGDPRTIDGVDIDDILSEELNTIVTIPNQSLIVLGGLYTAREENSRTSIPILGDIPLLGKLFSDSSDGGNVSELVIMVYASIAKGPSGLHNYQQEYDQRSSITPQTRTDFFENQLIERRENDSSKAKTKTTTNTQNSERTKKTKSIGNHRRR